MYSAYLAIYTECVSTGSKCVVLICCQECDLHATFDTWLNISTGPFTALVSKLMLCFHHLEQVDLFVTSVNVRFNKQ